MMGKKKAAPKQRSISEFFKRKRQFLKKGKKTVSAKHSPQYKNLENFFIPKTERPKEKTPLVRVKSQEFNGIILRRTEAQSMMALERLFGQKIPLISDPSKEYSMAFMAKDQHVVELYLTKYSLRGFIQITVFPEEICNLPHLRILDLKLTQIEKISDSLGNLLYLEKLDLSHNRITTIPESMGHLTQLSSLNLEYNKISRLHPNIGQLLSLEKLDLGHNHLMDIPQSFQNLKQIKQLDLNTNQIEHIPPFFNEMSRLEIIDLHNNHITTIDWPIISRFPSIHELYLFGNPIDDPQIDIQNKNFRARCWIFFNHPPSAHYLQGEIHYCPFHEKVLKKEKNYTNRTKGWVIYQFKCPVEGCAYEEEISPQYQVEEPKSENRSTSKRSQLRVVEQTQCPPHDIRPIELGKRLIFRCVKCKKDRDQII